MQTPTRFHLIASFAVLLALGTAFGVGGDDRVDRFRQLEEILPTPGIYRTASGAPGHAYWQQQVDYVIEVELDDENQRIIGSERITYSNNSPDELTYLWVQLDPNIFSPQSHAVRTGLTPKLDAEPRYSSIQNELARRNFDGSVNIQSVLDAEGADLPHTIVETMMRVDLPAPLASGAAVELSIAWDYEINNAKKVRGRTGYEYFEDDENYLYEIAQWFPRLAAYTDVSGWQNKQFLGRGEFTLEFGDYVVSITAPADHIVGSTGVLQNPDDVLTGSQRERLRNARTSVTPIFIVTPEEAEANESSRSQDKKTWVFQADNVRDFAFASSRKFIWDAVLHPVEGGEPAWCMSYWPNEGEPLWSQYSTQAIMHTLDVYSKFTFPYPYPVAISVNGPIGGMEYPMICFNGPRPEEDGTYSEDTKHGLIAVIIHEVGHNWFPMIVNSDERQWTWMDEGLNTFVEYLAEQEWETDFPSWGGEPRDITEYMASENQVPIMTNSESILQFGPNAYSKPAVALNILRETVMGRELFDFAFKQYSNRWRFKRPMPADLFRTMEDASAVDLDWFWRGWFFTTDHTDVAIENLRRYRIDTRNPDIEKPLAKAARDGQPQTLSQQRNAALLKRIDAFPELVDFYNTFDEHDITQADREAYVAMIEELDDEDENVLELDLNFYVIDLANLGGLAMPVVLEMHYEDGTQEELRIPAEVWRNNAAEVGKLVMTPKTIASIVLDPHLETADVLLENNYFPRRPIEERIQLGNRPDRKNPMQKAREATEAGSEAPKGN
jgi:hypothetical protein